MPNVLLLSLSVFLLGIGLAIILTKQHVIFMLIGIEIILNAANLNLIVFSNYYAAHLQGQVLLLMSMVVVVGEMALSLAIILQIYHHYQTISLDKLKL